METVNDFTAPIPPSVQGRLRAEVLLPVVEQLVTPGFPTPREQAMFWHGFWMEVAHQAVRLRDRASRDIERTQHEPLEAFPVRRCEACAGDRPMRAVAIPETGLTALFCTACTEVAR